MNARKKKRPPMQIQNVFVFLLLAVFAMSAIFLTALSAQVYRDTVEDSGRNNASRAAAAILRGAVQADDAGHAAVVEENGKTVLRFTNSYDGEIYYHRLYEENGYLRESLTSEEWDSEEEMGEALMAVTAFEPVLENNLLRIRVATPEAGEQEVCIYLRAGGAGE